MRILIFGDVVGKPGRNAIREVLPSLRKEHTVDAVIANVENLAHGKGITRKTLDELFAAGVDLCTSGNHILEKEGPELLQDPALPVLRPANFPIAAPGRGHHVFAVGNFRVLAINLIGTVFFRDAEQYSNPFRTVDEILAQYVSVPFDASIVDWHAEATSEKVALGWHLDGRVSGVFGTHTHVPTDDARILPAGTAYRTDLGMTGLRDAVLGVDRDVIIHNFLAPEERTAHQWSEHGRAQLHALLVDINPATRLATHVEKIDREIDV